MRPLVTQVTCVTTVTEGETVVKRVRTNERVGALARTRRQSVQAHPPRSQFLVVY